MERNAVESIGVVLGNTEPRLSEIICDLADHGTDGGKRQDAESVPSYKVDMLLIELGSVLGGIHMAQKYAEKAQAETRA